MTQPDPPRGPSAADISRASIDSLGPSVDDLEPVRRPVVVEHQALTLLRRLATTVDIVEAHDGESRWLVVFDGYDDVRFDLSDAEASLLRSLVGATRPSPEETP